MLFLLNPPKDPCEKCACICIYVLHCTFWKINSYPILSVCIYLVRPSPVNVPHSTAHRTYADSTMHVERVPQWTVKQSSFISWYDHRSSMSPRLGDWHWILQVPVGFGQFIHLTWRNFICQHSAITEIIIKQRPLSFILFDFHCETPGSVGSSKHARHRDTVYPVCSTFFVHTNPINMLTNRPCHGP